MQGPILTLCRTKSGAMMVEMPASRMTRDRVWLMLNNDGNANDKEKQEDEKVKD